MAPIPASAPAQHSSQEIRLEEVRDGRTRVAVCAPGEAGIALSRSWGSVGKPVTKEGVRTCIDLGCCGGVFLCRCITPPHCSTCDSATGILLLCVLGAARHTRPPLAFPPSSRPLSSSLSLISCFPFTTAADCSSLVLSRSSCLLFLYACMRALSQGQDQSPVSLSLVGLFFFGLEWYFRARARARDALRRLRLRPRYLCSFLGRMSSVSRDAGAGSQNEMRGWRCDARCAQ
ncbi:hypothetical protein DFH08DRAFT_873909 [Mycena albidolilacea]|uniref:Uncharacterized protein n=1 Tax=Mycena albidolilacea TaxID=1033008 RepID=A0AAD6ZWI2_9AGAR|nr:hypothetical protein DFH08DRAFT_873909 [Mycena albidolilacea]